MISNGGLQILLKPAAIDVSIILKGLKVLTSILYEKNTVEVNAYGKLFGYQIFSNYLLFCSPGERNSHRFETPLW